jgi:prepilin-type N-terminal cleavage/methylation domain-containing protein
MKQKSFTLIEILVVIVVIGVLSAFILVGMSSITSSANIAKSKAFLNSMDNSLLLARVSQWKLDNSSGTDSWSGKTATLVNSPTLTPNCAQDSCYTFNGTSQYAWIADDAVFNFGLYMSAFVWIKGAAQSGRTIFAQYDDSVNNKRVWQIATENNTAPYDKLRLRLSADGTNYSAWSSTGVILDNVWHFVGFTFNNTLINIYIDGKVDSSWGYTSLYNSDNYLTIGCQYGINPVGFFIGSIDDARLYNQAIPTSEVQQNYFVGINNLFKNNEIGLNEFNQRLVELKNNLANN